MRRSVQLKRVCFEGGGDIDQSRGPGSFTGAIFEIGDWVSWNMLSERSDRWFCPGMSFRWQSLGQWWPVPLLEDVPCWSREPQGASSPPPPPPPLVQDPPGQPSVRISTEQLKVGAKQIGQTVLGLPSVTVFGGRHYMSLSAEQSVERSPSSWQWRVTSSGGGDLYVSPVALFRLQLIAEQVGPHEVLNDTPLKVSSL